MTDNDKLNRDEKQAELLKYRDLILVTIDYHIIQMEISDSESLKHYESLKKQTEEHFQKERLTRLKQCFRDLIEMQIETRDLKFNLYLKEKTNYDIDVFKNLNQRIEKIIEKGKISTDNQYYDINGMVDQLSQLESVDNERIDILNKLLIDYEKRIKK